MEEDHQIYNNTLTNNNRIKLNVGGKLFETTISTLQSGGPDSLLSALSTTSNGSNPIFIDRDPEIFSVLLSLLRSHRLPSTASRFSPQELADESAYYGIESNLKSATRPIRLNGFNADLTATIKPASDGVVSCFSASDGDVSVWIAHGGQISCYDFNLIRVGTIRTHLDYITALRCVRDPEVVAVACDASAGLHFYNFMNGTRVGSVSWTDPSDPRIYKARVEAVSDSVDSVFASFDSNHRENCVLVIDKLTLQVKGEIGRQNGSSSKTSVASKLTYVPEINVVAGSAVTSGAFGYSGYVRLWDVRSGGIVWETNEPGSGRSSRFGDSFADVAVDPDELTLWKICSKSGDLAMADMRKLSDDPWVYLKDKNPSLRNTGGGSDSVLHCYRKQVFVGREGGLEVWSRVEEKEYGNVCEDSYRRNFVDKVEDAERGIIKKIEGGGDRLFVSRENVEGLEVWQSSNLSGGVSVS